MPNSWRVVMTLECISMRHGIEFGLGEMLYTYFLREHDREKGGATSMFGLTGFSW